ncbi:hypothetical protein OEZ86_010050 [Tetradesmus obliquus]|uniref:Diphthine--ammonia ligase n=1 Tax=Tetradesmus obliquus TaxID=3088 RepID=A0ABY8UNM3_TETOB|nr:hypothetical protein OEZ85_001485 [Tetradesmus obliquus]WIA43605.1 hypothetical protein OEZ86_010050 [Tetradesmus obliquus]
MAEATTKQRVWLSWSSGKDCAYALHTLRHRDDVDVVGLLTTFNGQAERVAMHAVRLQLLRMQAAAVGLPVHEVMLPFPCSNEDYQRCMLGAIEAARAADVQAIAFGDLFLADVRAYREKNMAGTGLGTLFPLWLADSGKSTAQLAQEMQAAGLRAVITCIDPKKLPKGFAGRFWDAQLLQEMQELGSGIDPCGENGEFHTFVIDGPMFSAALDVTVGEVVERDGFVFCDVLPAGVPVDEPAQQAEQQQLGQQQQQQQLADAVLVEAVASMVQCPGQQ